MAETGTYLHMHGTNHYYPGLDHQSAAVPLPPLAEVAAALREITEILACELAVPTVEPPHWSEFEWCIARAVAAMQGVASLLRSGSRWTGPAGWRRFLDEQHDHVAGRHKHIVQLLDRIDAQARRDEIAVVALKGTALHSIGIYEAGERPMADVDLLVHNVDVNATARLLEDCGFELTGTNSRHRLFESRLRRDSNVVNLGEHAENPLKIELHTSIRECLPIRETDITRFLLPHPANAGLNPYPSIAGLMMHLLLHAAGNMRTHALRLIQLHDVARLAARFGPCDWEELLTARPNDRGLWWALAPLTLTARYHPGAIPPLVIARLNAECPWLLGKLSRHRRLADVSWSDIRVHAFPGIEWSRTPQEAISFMFSRIWPSREARSELVHFAAHQPGACDVPWYGISQGARILRWVFSKPPRVQTLLTVRAALTKR
jgi:hypothetical protein